jgi:hypothetical protein
MMAPRLVPNSGECKYYFDNVKSVSPVGCGRTWAAYEHKQLLA